MQSHTKIPHTINLDGLQNALLQQDEAEVLRQLAELEASSDHKTLIKMLSDVRIPLERYGYLFYGNTLLISCLLNMKNLTDRLVKLGVDVKDY